jgi:hypothetical protein
MFLEDIIQSSTLLSNLNSRDATMLGSFSSQIWLGKSLTQKQIDAAVKLLRKYSSTLSLKLMVDVKPHLDSPVMKLGVRQIVPQTKRINYIDESPKRFVVSFPYDEEMVRKMRSFNEKNKADACEWDPEFKEWKVPVTERAVLFLKDVLCPAGFQVCEKTQEFFGQIDEILANFEEYVPQLVQKDGNFYFKNTHPSIPQPEGMNFLETLYHAKRYGITTWDDQIEENLKNGNFSIFTKNFLNPKTEEDLKFNGDELPLEIFDELIDQITPCLIVIPPGTEIQNLRKWWAYLNAKNFTKNQISVMFRTDNGNDRIFNEMVKDQGLNSPITEDTKFVVVSHKLPKPIVKSGIEFKSVINLGAIPGVHYSLQSYLADFPDQVMYYSRKKAQEYVS